MKAEAILRILLPPPRWIAQKVEHDFGIDFRVELAIEGKLRGCEFYVQVKGFADKDDISSSREVRIRCATARYWKEKLLPVLIAAINVDSGKGHFVWFDKGLLLPTDQDTISIRVPLDKNELLEPNVLESLAPFWEKWIEQIQDESKAAVYRKLLTDTLMTLDAVLHTYDALLFVPQGLIEKPEAIDRFREQAVHLCYMVIARWMHGVELYANTGLGTTDIDHQIRAMLDRSKRTLDSVMVPVTELGGWGVALINPTQAVPLLSPFRRVFFEIVDFLARRFAASAAGSAVIAQTEASDGRAIRATQ